MNNRIKPTTDHAAIILLAALANIRVGSSGTRGDDFTCVCPLDTK